MDGRNVNGCGKTRKGSTNLAAQNYRSTPGAWRCSCHAPQKDRVESRDVIGLLLPQRSLRTHWAWSAVRQTTPRNWERTPLNSTHTVISYSGFCFKKKEEK